MIRKNCQNCGRFYWRTKYHSKGSKYCSMDCLWESKRKQVECECSNCGNTFNRSKYKVNKQGANKHCSQECYTESQKNGIEYKCIVCNSTFYRSKSKSNKCANKYCSNDCESKGRKLYPKTLELRAKVRMKNERNILHDTYIKNLIAQSTKHSISTSDIPEELIELKRLNIKRKRLIKTQTQK